MLGSLRFMLALAVMVSHAPGHGLSFNPGIIAVICFYFISGYLMQLSYQRFVRHSETPIRDFYIDRILKLMPQYVLMVAISFIAISALGDSQWLWFFNQQAGVLKVILNLLLLPANYIFEPLVINAMLPHPIVPPAWSLATEAHFYLLLPIIFLLPVRGWLTLLLVVFTIQCGSILLPSGAYNANSFGYRYIFGVLTIFLFGYAYARRQNTIFQRVYLALWTYFLLLLVFGKQAELFDQDVVYELAWGGTLAMPLLALVSQVSLKRYRALDRYLGNLAYPLFICHMLAFYLAETLLGLHYRDWWLYFGASLLLSLLMAGALEQLQQRLENYRIGRRDFASLNR